VVNGSIDKLPDGIREQVDSLIADSTNTYDEIIVWLRNEGYTISKSALSRYVRRTSKIASRVADTLQRTQAIAKAVEEHPDLYKSVLARALNFKRGAY